MPSVLHFAIGITAAFLVPSGIGTTACAYAALTSNLLGAALGAR